MMNRIQRAQDRIEGELAAAWDDGELKGRTDGKLEGRQEERLVVAQNLLQKGMPTEFIAEITGLTENEIKTLVQ